MLFSFFIILFSSLYLSFIMSLPTVLPLLDKKSSMKEPQKRCRSYTWCWLGWSDVARKILWRREQHWMEALLSPAVNGFLLVTKWPLGLSGTPASALMRRAEQRSPGGGIREVQDRKAFGGKHRGVNTAGTWCAWKGVEGVETSRNQGPDQGRPYKWWVIRGF